MRGKNEFCEGSLALSIPNAAYKFLTLDLLDQRRTILFIASNRDWCMYSVHLGLYPSHLRLYPA